MSSQRTNYGGCPNNCVIRWTTDNGEHMQERPAQYRKRGRRVFCEKCGYTVRRGPMIAERLRE